jgi:hypothetical protein
MAASVARIGALKGSHMKFNTDHFYNSVNRETAYRARPSREIRADDRISDVRVRDRKAPTVDPHAGRVSKPRRNRMADEVGFSRKPPR